MKIYQIVFYQIEHNNMWRNGCENQMVYMYMLKAASLLPFPNNQPHSQAHKHIHAEMKTQALWLPSSIVHIIIIFAVYSAEEHRHN